METHETRPSNEERIWGAIAYASAIFLGIGFLAPALIWSLQRRRSGYSAFHALQALGYQVIAFTLWILTGLIVAIILLPLMAVEASTLGSPGGMADPEFIPFNTVFISWGVFFGAMLIYFLAAFLAAGFCLAGREFRLPLLGKWLARYLEYRNDPESVRGGRRLNEDREDRWVAAMSHAAIVFTMSGFFLPLLVWLFEKNRSRLLAFQGLQALAIQTAGLLAYLGAMALYIGSILIMAVGALVLSAQPDQGAAGLFMILFLLIILVTISILVLVVPLFQIFGQWADVRLVQGHDYHYPLFGRWLRRRLDRQSARRSGEIAPDFHLEKD
jgi:uncharacterized Tic20 family protein